MSKPTMAEIELEFYERFFISRGIDPYPVQEQAMGHIFAGRNVLVTVPTGTGKTLIAKAAILAALRSGKTAVYTTPLRALTEEKYRELADDFGAENVGFATGDYKVNSSAPIQVLVAEILWNRIYADRVHVPADVVIMDEGHYLNDPERGYVWEQSIIGLDPRVQLVVLSATVGYPQSFVQWCVLTRRVPMELVVSTERKVPLQHEFREDYLVECVKSLHAKAEVPAIIFSFSRKQAYEWARLMKSCPRFVTEDERSEIQARMAGVLLEKGFAKELEPLLLHGIGVHHAGVLPRYRQLVEELTLDRLLKIVVATETIAAGINLPAKRVVFPALRKHVKGEARILKPAEYHQMAGRAGRPQFDTEGIAITLAPEEVVQEIRKEIRDQKRGGMKADEAKIRQRAYMRAKTDARTKNDVSWDEEVLKKLVEGQPAALYSQTKITAEQILAIGLPDLTTVTLPGLALLAPTPAPGATDGTAAAPKAPGGVKEPDPTERFRQPDEAALAAAFTPPAALEPLPKMAGEDIVTVIDHLLLADHEKRGAQKRLAMIVRNLQALGVLDPSGRQVKGELIGQIRGMDGPFVWFALMAKDFEYEGAREFVEFLVDHDVIQKILSREADEKKRQWCLERMRMLRRENPHVTFEDAEAEYDREFPRELTASELLHQTFVGLVPHPELHGGKTPKNVWAKLEDEGHSFESFVERYDLSREEGSLFTYLARVAKAAKMLAEVTKVDVFATVDENVRKVLSVIDPRIGERG